MQNQLNLPKDEPQIFEVEVASQGGSYLKAFLDKGSRYLWPGASANKHEVTGSASDMAQFQSKSENSNSVIMNERSGFDLEHQGPQTGRFGSPDKKLQKSEIDVKVQHIIEEDMVSDEQDVQSERVSPKKQTEGSGNKKPSLNMLL